MPQLPPAGVESFSLYERGVEFSRGPTRSYFPWTGIDRVEWQGDRLVLYLLDSVVGVVSTHALDVPDTHRADVDSIVRSGMSHLPE